VQPRVDLLPPGRAGFAVVPTEADVTALGRDHGISWATAYRYVDEVISVLADQAPDLHEALGRAKKQGLANVILDGKIFSTDRCGEKTTSVKGKQIDLWYSGKAHEHGGNIQALSGPDGFGARPARGACACARRSVLSRLSPRPPDVGRRLLRGRGNRCAHPDQTACRRPGT
jgi:hypothetical protein